MCALPGRSALPHSALQAQRLPFIPPSTEIHSSFESLGEHHEQRLSHCSLRRGRPRPTANPRTDHHSHGPCPENEMMLPAILDPWAAHAMFEAAHLAAQFSGRKVSLVSVAPPSTLAANAVRYLSVTPPKQQRHTQHWAHRRKHRVRRALCRCPGAKIYGVQGAEFAHPRYASDVAAAEAICRAASPQLVIAPATSLFLRVLPAVANRLHGSVVSVRRELGCPCLHDPSQSRRTGRFNAPPSQGPVINTMPSWLKPARQAKNLRL